MYVTGSNAHKTMQDLSNFSNLVRHTRDVGLLKELQLQLQFTKQNLKIFKETLRYIV